MSRRIYVSGPYTRGDPEQNTANAIQAGNELLDAGFAPFVPHLSHYWHTIHNERHYRDWMRIDLAFVPTCHAILRLPGESPGADEEVALAQRCGIPIFHAVADLIDHFTIAAVRE